MAPCTGGSWCVTTVERARTSPGSSRSQPLERREIARDDRLDGRLEPRDRGTVPGDRLDPLREPLPVLEAVAAGGRETGIGAVEGDAPDLVVGQPLGQPRDALVEEAGMVLADEPRGVRIARAPGLEERVGLRLVGLEGGAKGQGGRSHRCVVAGRRAYEPARGGPPPASSRTRRAFSPIWSE